MMGRSTRLLSAGAVVVAAVGFVACPRPSGKLVIPVTISVDHNGVCTMPNVANIKSGHQVTWSVEPKPNSFQVYFPVGTASNPGSPFKKLVGSGHAASFPSANGDPVTTGQARRTLFQIGTFQYNFPIQAVAVNGTLCYIDSPTPDQNMKVHVD